MSKIIPPNPLILVDGSSYLFRAYHALPPLISSKGQPTGAIYGVVNMLRRLMKDYQPSKMAVIFDSKQKNFRHQLYTSYKANRTVMPDELQCQIEPLYALIKAMGLPLIMIDGIEADDIIGTLAKIAKSHGLFTLISTGDKDFAQIVDEKTFLINTMSQDIYDRERVIEKFEIPPEKMMDYFALVGDSVDNIPGIPQVGPKTAVKWLQTYDTLEGVIKNADQITGKVGEKLREHALHLPLFKKLVTIEQNLKLDFKPEDLDLVQKDDAKLKTLFTELEFKTWLRDLLMEQTQAEAQAEVQTKVQTEVQTETQVKAQAKEKTEEKAKEQSEEKEMPKLKKELILEERQLDVWIKNIKKEKQCVIHLCTLYPQNIFSEIIGISLAVPEEGVAYIPVNHEYMGAPKQLNVKKVLEKLKPLLIDPEIKKIGHQLKYLAEILANEDIAVQGLAYDVMLESYVLNSTNTKHDLEALVLSHLNSPCSTYTSLVGTGKKAIALNQVEIDRAYPYFTECAAFILRLHGYLWNKLNKIPELKKVYETIEIPLLPVLVEMERTGVFVDENLLKKQSVELHQKCEDLEKEAYKLANAEFNLNSPKQLQEILFNQLKLPVLEKTPTGQPGTGESVLLALAENYPLPKIILEYRSLSKLKSTYTDKLPEQIDPHSQRIHTSFHQAVTSTGRLSSSDPNLQNIPIRTPEGRKIRSAFKAPKGYKIVTADYSQIELRIMAHMSQDQGLINAFKEEDDIHRSTAAEVFGVKSEQVTFEQRRSAKIINFGLMYGMSVFGLSRQLGLEKSEAEKQIERYFNCFPGVKAMMNNILMHAKEKGYVETLYGRRLYLPELNSPQGMRRKAAERAAINAPMQGTNADIIKLAMVELDQFAKTTNGKLRMILQVHDELVFEIAEDVVDEMILKIKDIMENVITLSVHLRVGFGVGNNWEEAHH